MSEFWFKAPFLAAFIYAVAVAATTARRATRRHGGSLNQLEHEVRGLIAVRAALGIIFYLMLGIWLVRAHPPAWSTVPIPVGWRWAGVVLLAPVLAFFTWSFRSIDTNYRGGVGLHADHVLVTGGAYRWVRHPIYVAFIAVTLTVLLLSANWVLGLSGLLLVSSIAAGRIPTEERELGERFGRSWDDYRAGTGCLFPRLVRR